MFKKSLFALVLVVALLTVAAQTPSAFACAGSSDSCAPFPRGYVAAAQPDVYQRISNLLSVPAIPSAATDLFNFSQAAGTSNLGLATVWQDVEHQLPE